MPPRAHPPPVTVPPLTPSQPIPRPSASVRSVSADPPFLHTSSSSESGDVLSSLSVVRHTRRARPHPAGQRSRTPSPASRRAAFASTSANVSPSPLSPASAPPVPHHGRELARVNKKRSAASASIASIAKSASVQDQIGAYVKRTAANVSERVEENAERVVKALRGAEEDASQQVQDVQMESLNYDNLLDYVNERAVNDDKAQQRRHTCNLLLLKVAMTVAIAFTTAMLMSQHTRTTATCRALALCLLRPLTYLPSSRRRYFVNTIVKWASAKRIDTTVGLIETGYSALAYFSYTVASIAITAIASFLCTVIAPHARGGGVPYLFAYLNGTNVLQFFTLRIVSVKVVALAFTIAGGLTLGMEGPFVYIGGGVALLLSRGWDLLPGVSPHGRYTRILRNINEERIFMACGLAAGLSVAFSAPIAGILFAMEGATSFLTITAVLRIFACSMAALFFKDLSFNGWSAHISTTNLIVIVGQDTTVAWEVPEVLAFTLMAFIGGALGAMAVHLNVLITRWRHHHMEDRIKANMSEVALITGVTASIMFVLPLMFGCEAMPPFCADDGETRCQSLYCPLGSYSQVGSLVFSSSDIVARNLFDRTISLQNEYDPFPLLVYMTVYVVLVAWVYGAYVPGGLFVPSIVIGGCYGRVVGYIGEAYVSSAINPGVYALLGAAGMLGGFTRLGLPVVVMLVEMTGDATYLLPIMYVATLAKLFADYLEPPLYPQHMQIERIAQLGDKIPLAIQQLQAKDLSRAHYQAVHDIDTLERILDVLDLTKASTLPVTDEEGRFVGQIARASIAYALKYTPLYSTREAAIRRKELKPTDGRRLSAAGPLTSSGGSALGEELNATGGHADLLLAESAMGDWHDTNATITADFHEAHLGYFLNLRSLLDTGVFTVQQSTSARRVHAMFRRLGLSHLCVIDHQHQLRGIITRRSLITVQSKEELHSHEEAVHGEPDEQSSELTDIVEDEERDQQGVEPDELDQADVDEVKRPLPQGQVVEEGVKEVVEEKTRRGAPALSSRRAAATRTSSPQPFIAVTITPPAGPAAEQRPGLLRRKSTVQRIQQHTRDLR